MKGCVWVLQPLAMQTEALERPSRLHLKMMLFTAPLCGKYVCPSAMQAEVAELALLLGAAIQQSQDLSARSLLQGAAHNLFQVQPVRQAC